MFGKNKENSFQVNLVDGSTIYISKESLDELEKSITSCRLFNCKDISDNKEVKIIIDKIVFIKEV